MNTRVALERHLARADRTAAVWRISLTSLLLIVLGVLLGYTGRAVAEERTFRIEVHPVPTTQLTTMQVLAGEAGEAPTTVAGELRLPVAGDAKLPAVIMVHGGGGVYGHEDLWAEELNQLGVAVFILDSFTGRGFINPASIVGQTKDALAVSGFVMAVDAYRALAILAKHPRIDPNRIALMGFSRGGTSALYASLTRFRQAYGPAGIEFLAYVPLYPSCSFMLSDDERLSGGPIRIFQGTEDNITPIQPCRIYVDRLRSAGKDVELTEFPGAHHAFDMAILSTPARYPDLVNFGGCILEERPGGKLVNPATGLPVNATDACASRGATLGYDAQATAGTKKAVKQFLTAIFRLSQ